MPLNNFGLVAVTLDASNLFRSAQPDPNGYNTLEHLGVKTIIKLNSEEDPVQPPIKVIRRPLSPFFFDTGLVKQIATEIHDLIVTNHVPDQSVLVHCQHGRDRTGLVVGAFQLMFLGPLFNIQRVMDGFREYGVTGLDAVADIDFEGMLAKIAQEVGKL